MVLKENAAKGLFLGLAIGDAMGSPIEFEKKRAKENYVRSYLDGGWSSWKRMGGNTSLFRVTAISHTESRALRWKKSSAHTYVKP